MTSPKLTAAMINGLHFVRDGSRRRDGQPGSEYVPVNGTLKALAARSLAVYDPSQSIPGRLGYIITDAGRAVLTETEPTRQIDRHRERIEWSGHGAYGD